MAEARVAFARVAAPLGRVLDRTPFLLGDHFSAADVLVGGVLWWAARMALSPGVPSVERYAERLRARPAFQRAVAD
jgi:glutathione S-transferase